MSSTHTSIMMIDISDVNVSVMTAWNPVVLYYQRNTLIFAGIAEDINRVKKLIEKLTERIEEAENCLANLRQNPESAQQFREKIEELEDTIQLKKEQRSLFTRNLDQWLSLVGSGQRCGESGSERIQENTPSTKQRRGRGTKRGRKLEKLNLSDN